MPSRITRCWRTRQPEDGATRAHGSARARKLDQSRRRGAKSRGFDVHAGVTHRGEESRRTRALARVLRQSPLESRAPVAHTGGPGRPRAPQGVRLGAHVTPLQLLAIRAGSTARAVALLCLAHNVLRPSRVLSHELELRKYLELHRLGAIGPSGVVGRRSAVHATFSPTPQRPCRWAGAVTTT
jgi:hypothetical protein